MKPRTRIGIVVAGYIVAVLLATVATAIHMALTSDSGAPASGGMYAFGDALLFIAVFGVTSLVPTGVMLVFLRPYRWFWVVLSAIAVCVAATGFAAAILFAIGRHALASSPLAALAGPLVIRIFMAPVFALTFLVCAVITPYPGPRLAFLAAALLDAAASAYGAFVWFVHVFLHKP